MVNPCRFTNICLFLFYLFEPRKVSLYIAQDNPKFLSPLVLACRVLLLQDGATVRNYYMLITCKNRDGGTATTQNFISIVL